MEPYLSLFKKADYEENPHACLGLKENKYIFQFSPNYRSCEIVVRGEKKQMELLDPSGYFLYEDKKNLDILDYQIIHSDGTIGYDPYAFSLLSRKETFANIQKDEVYDLHEIFGAHSHTIDGIKGVKFTVFTPGARKVYLCCDLGNWRETIYPMKKLCEQGVYEIFIPGCMEDMNYKYRIVDKENRKFLKSDPFARRYELRPKTASVVHKKTVFEWTDKEFMRKRGKGCLSDPMNIYQMHLGAWSKTETFPNYKEIAPEIVLYLKEMGYTHLELLPIKEHPYDESWGYQSVGYFSPTSRYGTYRDLQYFINYLHLNDIGIIIDFVPAHFPKDESFLANFDGKHLFEHSHPLRREHPLYGTMVFDFSSPYVQNFLISSADFWIKHMHVDGIRVDAVATIVYLNIGRDRKDEIVNQEGGVEDLGGIEFLCKLNHYLQTKYPDVMTFAEDISIFGKTTKPISEGGLGFDMKWNTGWAYDIFQYLQQTEEEKIANIGKLISVYQRAFDENYLLVISHDDVSNGKKSLLNKFSNQEGEKYEYLRFVYSLAITHPGKKLFFMGHEVGEEEEFTPKNSWRKRKLSCHRKLKHKCFTKEMNDLYLQEKALHEIDFDRRGFSWIDYSHTDFPVISFLRKGVKEKLLVIHNFSKENLEKCFIGMPGIIMIDIIFNSDLHKYGGKSNQNGLIFIEANKRGVYLYLARLSTVICKVVIDDRYYF